VAGASETELALALAKAMAGIAILDWEGVGDAAGVAVPVSPRAAAALMDVWPLFEASRRAMSRRACPWTRKKTPPRARRVALRRRRRLLPGVPGALRRVPGPPEPSGDRRGRAGLGLGAPDARPAPGDPGRGARVGPAPASPWRQHSGCRRSPPPSSCPRSRRSRSARSTKG
jgi:hypothetical protein